LRGEAEKKSVEMIFSESGYEYDFAFPGASFSLLDGFWLDLIVKGAEGGAAVVGAGLTKAAWARVVVVIKKFGKIFRQGRIEVLEDGRPTISYELPEGTDFDRAAEAIPPDYARQRDIEFSKTRRWLPDGTFEETLSLRWTDIRVDSTPKTG
jgi:hypothetical protein